MNTIGHATVGDSSPASGNISVVKGDGNITFAGDVNLVIVIMLPKEMTVALDEILKRAGT